MVAAMGLAAGDLMGWGGGEKSILYVGAGGDAAGFFCNHVVNSKENVFDSVSVAWRVEDRWEWCVDWWGGEGHGGWTRLEGEKPGRSRDGAGDEG